MTPAEALAYACRESGITPPPHEVNTGHVMASILIKRLPEGSALVTAETLAAALHAIGPWADETDKPTSAEREDAVAIIEALRRG